MEVILTQLVPKLGKKGQIVKVANGYARNYLFPKKLGIIATPKQVAALNRQMTKIASQLASEKSGAEKLKEKLDGQTLRIEGKVAQGGEKLFGAVTSQDIIDLIDKEFGIKLDRKQVGLLHPIKRVGSYEIQLDLHQDVDAYMNAQVYDPKVSLEETSIAEAEV